MTEKLIYGREQLNNEFIENKKRLEEIRKILNNSLETKLDMKKEQEQKEIKIKNNQATYKKFKREELKRMFINILQVVGIFGVPALLCNFPMIPIELNTYAINIILGSLGGIGSLTLIGIHMTDIIDFKKECNITDKETFSYLLESIEEASLDNEITELQKDIKEIDEKINKLDEVIIKEEPKQEKIDYQTLKSNIYMNFIDVMKNDSKPKQKGLKK